MDLTKEYESYLKFTKNFFPGSSILKANQIDKFKNIIQINLKSIKLLDTYFHVDYIRDDTKRLINDLRFFYMRLLYALPMNDYFFIDVILRSMSENLLRIVYISTNENLTYTDVISCNYRKLWKDGIKRTHVFQTYKDNLSNINRIFSSKSLTIHNSQNEYDNHIEHLVNLMSDDTIISIEQLKSDIKAMFEFLYNDLFNILSLNHNHLTMQQSLAFKSLT